MRFLLHALFLFAAVALAFPNVQAQVCEGDRFVRNQSDADLFNCLVVTGNLLIGGNEPIHGNTLSEIYDLDGLSELTEVGGDLSIVWNAPHMDIDSLYNITHIGGDLLLFQSGFTRVDGLAGVSQLGGNIRIQNNRGPNNLDGLSGITEVNGYVSIIHNYDLLNVDGLANIESISGLLGLSNNSSLSECSVGLADLLESGGVRGGTYIGNNAPGCNSVEEILNGVDAESEATPLVTGLEPPYPNPTAGATTVTFTLAEPDEVTLTVYDALGRRVRTLAEGPQSAGEHEVTLGTGLPAGTYVVQFEAGGEAWTERVTVVR